MHFVRTFLTHLLKVHLCHRLGQFLLVRSRTWHLRTLIALLMCQLGIRHMSPRFLSWTSSIESDLHWEKSRTKLRMVFTSWRIHRAANQEADIQWLCSANIFLSMKSTVLHLSEQTNISVLWWKWEDEMSRQPDKKGGKLSPQCLF